LMHYPHVCWSKADACCMAGRGRAMHVVLTRATIAQVDKVTRWGDLESDEEESEEEEEEEEGESDAEAGAEGEGVADGTQSQVSGYGSSLPSGIETPDVLDLRKGKAAGAVIDHQTQVQCRRAPQRPSSACWTCPGCVYEAPGSPAFRAVRHASVVV